MRKHVGLMLMATAGLHIAVGLVLYRGPLLAMAGAGLVGSVTGDSEREAAFWFILFGAVLLILGQLVHALLKRDGEVPRAFAWGLLGLALAGAAIMPDSGFWLVLPQIWLLLSGRRDGGPGVPLGGDAASTG